MLPGAGARLCFINTGDWSDGLEREGSNPSGSTTYFIARVEKSVNSADLKSAGASLEGSSPSLRTTLPL